MTKVWISRVRFDRQRGRRIDARTDARLLRYRREDVSESLRRMHSAEWPPLSTWTSPPTATPLPAWSRCGIEFHKPGVRSEMPDADNAAMTPAARLPAEVVRFRRSGIAAHPAVKEGQPTVDPLPPRPFSSPTRDRPPGRRGPA